MIGTLRGAVTHAGPDYVVVEIGGVGYRVVVAPKLLARLRPEHDAHFFIHHLVREDHQALFGFSSSEELAFELSGPWTCLTSTTIGLGAEPTRGLR